MKNKKILSIKRRSQPEWLVWLVVFLPLMLGFLTDLLGIPGATRYLVDVVWVTLVFYLYRATKLRRTRGTGNLVFWISVFLLYSATIYLVQYQSALYYLWGFRNEFRFYFAFFSFVVFLNEDDSALYLRLFDKLFWISFVASLFQFSVQGIRQDLLGGLFGVVEGANGYTNIFFLIIVTKSLIFYLNSKEKAWSCAMKCLAALLVAALAELKFFFVEFAIVMVLTTLFTRFTMKKLGVVFGGCIALVMCAALLAKMFPNFADFFSVQWFWENAFSDKGYNATNDLNRLNAISRINELWLTNGWQRAFGLGLGNCDTSGFAFLNTPFFEKYGDYHYNWFSYVKIYLETGWLGLIFYFGFFVLVYRGICKIQKRVQGEAACYCLLGRIMAVLCMIISVYNSSLRTEAGYMAYFILAIPFAMDRGMRDMEVANAEKTA